MLRLWGVKIQLLMALMSLSLLTGCNALFSQAVRLKIEVEVNDHGTVRRGSSVWSIERPPFAQTRVRGDAVAVDLGDGRTVYALIVGDDGHGEPTSTDDVEMLPSRLFGNYALELARSGLHGT